VTRIGFVGLGRMGRPMAMNLVRHGADLTVCATRDASLAPFHAAGVRTTTDVSDVAHCELVFLCLPNGDVVRDVVLGEVSLTGLGSRVEAIVDTSTIAHARAVDIARELAARGIAFVDAPVTGMEARAVAGTLTAMCGGRRDAFERVQPLLAHMASTILYMGPAGSGQLTKLVNQLLFNINAAALAEILPMSVKMGLDPHSVAEVVNSGTGRSYASEFFLPRILDDRFGDGYSMAKAYKDMVSAAEIGSNRCIPMPVLNAAAATYQMALLRGHGESDKGGMIRVFEELLGVRYRRSQREAPRG
jgi:3-hydroxyisobutyrate dehydrogenase-like beta-hydroxyacid dehydrogenase